MSDLSDRLTQFQEAHAANPTLLPAARRMFTLQVARARRGDGSLDEEALAEAVATTYANAPAVGLAKADLLRAVLENLAQGVCFFDRNGRLIIANRRYAEIYGLSPEDIPSGTSLRDIVTQRYLVGSIPEMSADAFLHWRAQVIRTAEESDSVVELRNGRVIAIRHQPLADGGWVATHEDITERRETERQLAFLSHYHPVTGLPNSVLLAEQLQEVLRNTSDQAPCAALSLALDGLPAINDALGRRAAAGLLRLQAQRLRDRLGPRDLLFQQGDNEFVIIQCRGPQPGEATRLAMKLLELIGKPAVLGGQSLLVRASIGIAPALTAGLDAGTLLKNADIALHQAQLEAPGEYLLFEPGMDQEVLARRQLELDLRDAVEHLAFELHYQPLIDVKTTQVVGFEALLRWTRPGHGAVAPAVFIPLAEQLGLIDRIGEFVLQTACGEAASWPNRVGLAVNVSAMQFVGGALPGLLADTLHRTGLAPSRLSLEITESCVVTNPAAAASTLAALRASGVRIAMDDFGTGYSSLSVLPLLPFDAIKIDRSFIATLGEGPAHVAIVRAIISLSASLGATCTAEGVETEEQFAILAREHCTEVQGFLFGAPRPAAGVAELLREGSMRPGQEAPATPAAPRVPPAPRVLPAPGLEVPGLDAPPDISFTEVVHNAPDIIMITDAELDAPGPVILYVNPAFTRLTGYTAEEAVGRSPRFLQGPGTSRGSLNAISARLRAGREVQEAVLNYAKNGTPYWLDLRIVPVADSTGRIVQFVAVQRDVTGDRGRLERLENIADRDALTGIFNRRALLRTMQGALRTSRSYRVGGPCLAYLDIDRFKQVNDAFGHAVGDTVLLGLAQRLVENVRRLDTVGRMGGEEFVVCMPAITLRDAAAIGERLRRSVSAEPFATPAGPLWVSISVGVSEVATGEPDLADAMRRADRAMYVAKRAGGNRMQVDPDPAAPDPAAPLPDLLQHLPPDALPH